MIVSALCMLVGCGLLERTFHGDRVNERRLAEGRRHARLELSVRPSTVHAGERIEITGMIRYSGDTPLDVCTERGGVSTWLERPASKFKFPLRVYGTTTDVLCARSLHLQGGGVERFSDQAVIPKTLSPGVVYLCAGMSFDYCGNGDFGCAYSYLRSDCIPITLIAQEQ